VLVLVLVLVLALALVLMLVLVVLVVACTVVMNDEVFPHPASTISALLPH
jgi:hypothetical protein